MDDYGENNKINFKQFIFLLAKFRQRGKMKSSVTEFNSRDNKLRFLFDVSKQKIAKKERDFLFSSSDV
jgi:hypothetical protein